ncbi:MAG: anti-sigma factor family protein [Candidatus Dormibacteria bacterium]
MTAHVDELFSAAYDGELDPGARAAFDRHLAGCPACAAGLARLTTAVDALRELGPARMPRSVRLPEGAPAAARRLVRWPLRLPRGRGLVAGLTAAGMVAVAGGVTALVVTRDLTPVRSSTSSGVALPGAAAGGRAAIPAAPVASPLPSAGLLPLVGPLGCPAEVLATSPASAAEIPAGFNNHQTEDDGVTTVVLATPVLSYSPGETVDVYARLIDDGSQTVYLPCTFLEGPVSATSSPTAVPASSAAVPAGGLSVDGQPLLQVQVPATAVAGDILEIAVEVPSAVEATPTVEGHLSIEVS